MSAESLSTFSGYGNGSAVKEQQTAMRFTADHTARIPTMSATMVADLELRRLVEFASDAAELADRRRDAELRELIADLHADLLALRGDDDG
jgi:hypothetical protein